MLTVAYLANEFPSNVEPYVWEEIEELRRRGVRVIAGSVWRPKIQTNSPKHEPAIVIQGLGASLLARAAWFSLSKWKRILPLLMRVGFSGPEKPVQRLKALIHTLLGSCYALKLRDCNIDHIHVHHGYFGSWVAMTAARLLDVGFSMTLHGSDLLLDGNYLDVKLANCSFCLTISQFNRNYILRRFRDVDPQRILVSRLGVEVADGAARSLATGEANCFNLLAVGRLHSVKDHAFLVRGCAELLSRGVRFKCRIAGEGPERRNLESLVQNLALADHVSLLGHVPRERLAALYEQADVIVLTSQSEGIPLVLMEAMAHGRIVLAPAITGIPELVVQDETGFLYEPGSLHDFVARLEFIERLGNAEKCCPAPDSDSHSCEAAYHLEALRRGAHLRVLQNFNRRKNLERFGDCFIKQIFPQMESRRDADLILQQI